MLNAIDKLRYKSENILIHHAAFETAVNRIQRCYNGALGADPLCLSILGESRTGKTSILKYFESKYPRFRVTEGLKVPIIRINVHSKPTVKGLVDELLYALDDPLYAIRATENEKTRQLKRQLKNTETRIIFLDEFQHFIDQATHKVQHHVTDWLKMVINDTRIGLVVAGLPSSNEVISQNEQLARRFQSPVKLKRFDWSKLSDQNEFRTILYNIQRSLEEFSMPDLDSDEMALRIYVASGGLIGYVIKILREAISMALDTNSTNISLSTLKQAYEMAIMDKNRCHNNPFNRNFSFAPTRSLIDQILDYNNSSRTKILNKNISSSSILKT